MKIIQSFWTIPFLQTASQIQDSRFNGGWISRKYSYLSWVFSCLQLRKFYDEVELVTDTPGSSILIDKLRLPYTAVSVGLDKLHGYHPGLWAIGKIYAYSIQSQPFLHVDNDIFIFNRFDDSIADAALVAQNLEAVSSQYTQTFRDICERFSYVPDFLRELSGGEFIACSNAGIIGGQDTGFFQDYTKEVFHFVDTNAAEIEINMASMNSAYLNVVAEQVIYTQMARRAQRDIQYLFPDTDNIPDNIGFFHESRNNKGFVHCLGTYKKQRMAYRMLEILVKRDYPDHYERVTELLANSEL